MIEHRFGVSKELTAVISALGLLDRRLMPNLSKATEAAAFHFKIEWADYADGAEIPGAPPGSAIRGHYMKYGGSIKHKAVNAFQHIVWTSDKKASRIENGEKNIDLKIAFKKSSKARKKEDGGWYLTIPIRHNVSSLKKAGISQKKLSAMAFSKSTGLQAMSKGKGNIFPLSGGKIRKWIWGDTIKTDNKILQGLVRLKGESRITKEGKEIKQTGGYLTFRRVSDKSPAGSWVIKNWPKNPKGGKKIFAMAVKNTKKDITEMMERGIEADIRFALTGS